MKFDDKSKQMVELLLCRLDETRETTMQSVHFTHDYREHYMIAIAESFGFSNEIPHSEAVRMVWGSTCEVATNNSKLTIELVTKELKKRIENYLQKPTIEYTLLTSVSMSFDKSLRSWSTKNSKIRFTKKIPRNFIREHRPPEQFEDLSETDYTWVRVEVDARCELSALSLAENELNYARSIWNWQLNKTLVMTTELGLPEPVNKLVLGPSDTLHLRNGESVQSGICWYRTSYRGPKAPIPMGKLNSLKEVCKKAQAKIEKLDSTIEKAAVETLRIYTLALDESNYTLSFVRLWGALEAATGEYRDNIVKRAVKFAGLDEALHNHFLKVGKSLRNGVVHEGHGLPDGELRLHWLRRYVEKVLHFLVYQTEFPNFSEIGDFLELSNDPRAIESQLKRVAYWETIVSQRNK